MGIIMLVMDQAFGTEALLLIVVLTLGTFAVGTFGTLLGVRGVDGQPHANELSSNDVVSQVPSISLIRGRRAGSNLRPVQQVDCLTGCYDQGI